VCVCGDGRVGPERPPLPLPPPQMPTHPLSSGSCVSADAVQKARLGHAPVASPRGSAHLGGECKAPVTVFDAQMCPPMFSPLQEEGKGPSAVFPPLCRRRCVPVALWIGGVSPTWPWLGPAIAPSLVGELRRGVLFPKTFCSDGKCEHHACPRLVCLVLSERQPVPCPVSTKMTWAPWSPWNETP
jgi:hypothetical protein